MEIKESNSFLLHAALEFIGLKSDATSERKGRHFVGVLGFVMHFSGL